MRLRNLVTLDWVILEKVCGAIGILALKSDTHVVFDCSKCKYMGNA